MGATYASSRMAIEKPSSPLASTRTNSSPASCGVSGNLLNTGPSTLQLRSVVDEKKAQSGRSPAASSASFHSFTLSTRVTRVPLGGGAPV